MPALIDAVERRQRLVGAAWRIALDEGLSAATVRRVAVAAELSPSAVQRAFPAQSALHRLLAVEIVRRNREDMHATQGCSPVDSVMALLPVTIRRQEVMTLASQMRHSSQVFVEYPMAAVQVRTHLRFFCEHQFRKSAGLSPTAPLKGVVEMSLMRFQVVFDGLSSALLEDQAPDGAPPNLTLIRGLVLQVLPPVRS